MTAHPQRAIQQQVPIPASNTNQNAMNWQQMQMYYSQLQNYQLMMQQQMMLQQGNTAGTNPYGNLTQSQTVQPSTLPPASGHSQTRQLGSLGSAYDQNYGAAAAVSATPTMNSNPLISQYPAYPNALVGKMPYVSGQGLAGAVKPTIGGVIGSDKSKIY